MSAFALVANSGHSQQMCLSNSQPPVANVPDISGSPDTYSPVP